MISTCSFLLDGDFPKADGTAEIKEKYHLVGGETGTAAAVLCSLNVPVKLGGTHLGSGNEKHKVILRNKTADLFGACNRGVSRRDRLCYHR